MFSVRKSLESLINKMLKIIVLSMCVAGALSSFLRSDSSWPKVCPIDLEYNPKLKKCVEPVKIKESSTLPDYIYLMYDEVTEKTTATPPVPVAPIDPDEYFIPLV